MKAKAAFCTPNSVSKPPYGYWASAILLGDTLEYWRIGPILLLAGLAPNGVCHAPRVTARPVGSYPTFSPLPCYRRFIFCGTFRHRLQSHAYELFPTPCLATGTVPLEFGLSSQPRPSLLRERGQAALRMQLSKNKYGLKRPGLLRDRQCANNFHRS